MRLFCYIACRIACPRVLVLLAACVSPQVVVAGQGAAPFAAADKVAIYQMYDRYAEAFIQKDYPTLRECVDAPFLVMEGELRSLDSFDAIESFYRTLREALDRRSYGRGEIVGRRLIPLTANRALLHVAYRRYRKDGEFLQELASFYLVVKSAGTWKLRSVVNQELQYFGNVGPM